MKQIRKSFTSLLIGLGVLAISLTSCYETHYYHHYHHHTREWYEYHHEPAPAGINFDIDVR